MSKQFVVQWLEGGIIQVEAADPTVTVVSFDFDELSEGEAEYGYLNDKIQQLVAVPSSSAAYDQAQDILRWIRRLIESRFSDRTDLTMLLSAYGSLIPEPLRD